MASFGKKKKPDVPDVAARYGGGNLRSEMFRSLHQQHLGSAEFEAADVSRSFRELTKIFAENGATKPPGHSTLAQPLTNQPTAKQAKVHKALLARGQSIVSQVEPNAISQQQQVPSSILSNHYIPTSGTGRTLTSRFRQYQVGDLVLVRVEDTLVQCTIVHVHNGALEDLNYSDGIPNPLLQHYTVARVDNGIEFRADSDSMELLWSSKTVYGSLHRCLRPVTQQVLRVARNFLYGVYMAHFRCTWILVVNLASFWFLIVDQVRLAFVPPSADYTLAVVQWIVWMVLVTELLLEIFVRPTDYRTLLRSEKAYTPRTVRFIHGSQWFAEATALALFIPEFRCIFVNARGPSPACSESYTLQFYRGAFLAVTRQSRAHIVAGYAVMSLSRLRVLALVRRWKNRVTGGTGRDAPMQPSASIIGTAIMATHAQSAAVGALAIVCCLPLLLAIQQQTQTSNGMTALLHQWISSPLSCELWEVSITSWLETGWRDGLLSVEVYPPRCSDRSIATSSGVCNSTANGLVCKSDRLVHSTIRQGSIAEFAFESDGLLEVNGTSIQTVNSVIARFDETQSIGTAALASLLLQVALVSLILFGLSVMRRDAEHLVLGPLRRMLKIVAHYSKNPLVRPRIKRTRSKRPRLSGRVNTNSSDDSDALSFGSSDEPVLEVGSFETEQLITAVAKITDLLRKCWGVAGADIISTNLATQGGALTEVFNPTVPGRSVYALFGFVAIGGFDNAVRNLGGDIMPLINDISKILHGEVARWGFGDSGGECNKNLGGAFLMVFRIGLVTEVIAKLEQATDVVFSTGSFKSIPANSNMAVRSPRKRQARRISTDSVNYSAGSSSTSDRLRSSGSASNRRKPRPTQSTTNAMSLSLQSLPGISTFTDRAVIGLLKSFAGIHRDHKILSWNDDFRLGAGVGAFNISTHTGLDAGWAVEGAVGSEYKIDATYLSPHVNNASRMTSACKQYDVTILLSQAVQELMSDVAQSKIRHLDTVTVKGYSVKQKIYTYDARANGVNFFLNSRTEEQADFDADRYQPSVWNTDKDLVAMRQHVTEDFLSAFKQGQKAFLSGAWPAAIQHLEAANDIMFQRSVDEGLIDDDVDALNINEGEDIRGAADEIRREGGDGPSLYLLNFMKSHGGVAPKDWDGWHPLTRK